MRASLFFGRADPEWLLQLFDRDEEAYLDALQDVESADFSLHLVPEDLDVMSLAFGSFAGRDPRPLRPSLTVLRDSADGGLLAVDDAWVHYAASVGTEHADAVTEAWFARLRSHYRDPELTVTDEARLAVQALLALCRRNGPPLLHWWWL